MFDSKSMTARGGRRTIRPGTALLVALLALAGCSEIKPYKPFDNREEGFQNGALTGSQGEFVIFSYKDKPKREQAPEDGKTENQESLEGEGTQSETGQPE